MDNNFYPLGPFWTNYGYYDLGPPQVPPAALWVGMTDRATNSVWYLGFDPCFDGRICLVDASEIPLTKNIVTVVHGPYDGPYVGQYGLRLGVRNGHLLYDSQVGNGASLPAAFDLSGNQQLWLQLHATSVDNPNFWDHLAYDGVPWFFFGLTDQADGSVWYVALDRQTQHVCLLDSLHIPNVIRARTHVYGPLEGPGIGTSGWTLRLRGGHVLAHIGTKQFTLIPAMAFDSWGATTPAALFAGATVTGPFGIADQPPDHVAYSVVVPVTNECPGGPGEIESPEFLLTTDDGEIILSDGGLAQTP